MHLSCLLVLICCAVFDASLAQRLMLSWHSHLHSCCYSDSHSLCGGHWFFLSMCFFFYLSRLSDACCLAAFEHIEGSWYTGCWRVSSVHVHRFPPSETTTPSFTPFAFSSLPWRLKCWNKYCDRRYEVGVDLCVIVCCFLHDFVITWFYSFEQLLHHYWKPHPV